MSVIFEMAVVVFEAVAVIVLIVGGVISTGYFIKGLFPGEDRQQAYSAFRN